MMNKLQLYIYMSRRGFKSVRCINPAENVQSQIPQLRGALESVEYNAAEKYLFYAISYTDEGVFFSILRTIPPEAGDHLASYIYIPNGLKITSAQLMDVVNRVTRVVSSPSVTTEQLADLQQTFSQQYQYDASAPAIAASMGKDCAVVYYGGDRGLALADFLCDYIFQPQFLGWKAVMLIDDVLQVETSAPVLDNVAIRSTVALLPPDVSDTKFTPHIYHHPFTRAFRAELGGTVKVRWHRGGFEEQIQSFKVTGEGMTLPTPTTDESRKAITPASFLITSQATKHRIADAHIRVNGVDIVDAHQFTQNELKNALVEINAAGFAPFRSHLDLASTTQALIQLPEQRRVFRFEIALRSSSMGAPLHFDIPSKSDITESPIEGYEPTEPIREGVTRINRLQYTPPVGIAPKTLIISIVAALAIGFLVGFLMGGSKSSGVKDRAQQAVENAQKMTSGEQPTQPAEQAQVVEPTPSQPSQPTQTAEQPEAKPAEQPAAQTNTATVSSDAIAYLDNNKVWAKADLDKFPALKGLFEDINSYNFSSLVSHWGPMLSKSKRFQEVVTSAQNCINKKKFKPASGDTYCKSGDTKITVYAFRCRIDP